MSVCLDTNVLVWGVQKKATPNRVAMIERAERFLTWLAGEKETIVVPSVVLGEFLSGVPKSEHAGALSAFHDVFAVAPFDAAAAAIAANLWLDYKARQPTQDAASAGPGRHVIKADCQIVATAIASQASVLYSDDPDMAALANGRLRVEAIPSIPAQSVLL
jgi:predicted nucleic acid-binding protein